MADSQHDEIGGTGKRNKRKGACHNFSWDILDNKNILAEEGWESLGDMYWTQKECKTYVKMYHIDKLWPREQHDLNTRTFSCKPGSCMDDHFMHRAYEVWTTLFGDRKPSKAHFNYTILCMVYAELILKRSVSWCTYPTTKDKPLQIGWNVRDIPDLYLIDPLQAKNVVAEFRKKPGHWPPLKSIAKNEVQKFENEISHRMEEKKPVAIANVIATMFPTATETNVPVIPRVDLGITVKSSNDTKGKAVVDEVEVEVDNECSTHLTAAGGGCSDPRSVDNGPSSLAIVQVPTKEDSPKDAGHSISDIMGMLKSMPNSESLKELLDFSIKWTEVCSDEWRGGLDNTTEGEVAGKTTEEVQQIHNVLKIAKSLKDGASILGAMAPDLLNMAHAFGSITPGMIHGALGFETLVSSIKPLLEARVQLAEENVALSKELMEATQIIDQLSVRLDKVKKNYTVQLVECEKYHPKEKGKSKIEEVRPKVKKETAKLEKMDGVIQLPSDDEDSDDLNFSKFLNKSGDGATEGVASQKSKSTCGQVSFNIGSSQATPKNEERGKGPMDDSQEVDNLLRDLEVARRERDEARTELQKLKSTIQMVDDTPCSTKALSWLGWVHKLRDKETIVSKAQQDMKKCAITSMDVEEAIQSSLQKYNEAAAKGGEDATKITIWRDVEEMMERTLHSSKNRRGVIDWALEVEEGWMPYDVLSSHLDESKREVIRTRKPSEEYSRETCSICQQYFGPEGAFEMGHCNHKFHITCIAKAALNNRQCVICRSPISSRFYEMLGLQHLMPPGHEFDRWNLPLDQLPKKEVNWFDWGKSLTWNPTTMTHQLSMEGNAELDDLSWMTHDYEVEVRAREIPNAKEREFFCRNFGGHWSVHGNRFFRFPKPEVVVEADGTRREVEREYGQLDEYKMYDRTPVGRALVLRKLEEAIRHRRTFTEESFKYSDLDYWVILKKSDDALQRIVSDWRRALRDEGNMSHWSRALIEKIVQETVAKIEKAKELWDGKNSKKRNRDSPYEDDPEWGEDNRRKVEAVEEEYRSGGTITRPSQRRVTRGSNANNER